MSAINFDSGHNQHILEILQMCLTTSLLYKNFLKYYPKLILPSWHASWRKYFSNDTTNTGASIQHNAAHHTVIQCNTGSQGNFIYILINMLKWYIQLKTSNWWLQLMNIFVFRVANHPLHHFPYTQFISNSIVSDNPCQSLPPIHCFTATVPK